MCVWRRPAGETDDGSGEEDATQKEDMAGRRPGGGQRRVGLLRRLVAS